MVEAAPENLELKRELFAALADSLRAGGDPRHQHLLAAGDRIAAGTPHPERVVGMHFFNPPR